MKKTSQQKKTTKAVKPVFTVDLTEAEDSFDAMLAFAWARFDAKLPLSKEDLLVIVISELYDFVDGAALATVIAKEVFSGFCEKCERCEKKTPWYKKVWNWITKPFRKKK